MEYQELAYYLYMEQQEQEQKKKECGNEPKSSKS